jgi:microcystin-dependent protein
MKYAGLISALGAAAMLGGASPCFAQATDPFLGQIMMVGFSFCPRGWADANGQLMAISTNTALFALLGTTYGGNGVNTFALPDLQGRVAMGQGNGAGLPPVVQGEVLGSPTTTLTTQNLPAHNHTLVASSDPPNDPHPQGNYLANFPAGQNQYTTGNTTPRTLHPSSIGMTGNNVPFDQHQPSLVMRYCIALVGVFPSRN